MSRRQQVVMRVLVQAEADADPIEFALRAASGLGGRLLVVNATGKELGGYAMRYDFDELVDADGIPTRSISEIIERVEEPEVGALGCLVVLDVARVYRASRCAVRRGESVRELSPGHWDDVNETLGRLGEVLTRRGVPSVWTAPSTAVHRLDDDGREVVVGTAPQAWKDLLRQAHVWLSLVRRGTAIDAELRADDFRALGQLGEVLRDVDGKRVGQLLAPFVSRAARCSTTLLDEAAVAELAARARLEAADERRGEQLLHLYQELAPVRALRGREHWDALMRRWSRDRHRIRPERARGIEQILAGCERTAEASWRQVDAYERTSEMCSADPEQSLDLQLAGPSPIDASPTLAVDIQVAVDELVGRELASWVDALPAGELVGWCRALGEALEVWTRPLLARIAVTVMSRHRPQLPAPLPVAGRSWAVYTEEQLRDFVASLMRMWMVERAAGPGGARRGDAPREGSDLHCSATPESSEHAIVRAQTCPRIVADEDSIATYLELLDVDEAQRSSSPLEPLEIPSSSAFVELDARDQSTILAAVLTLASAWSELPQLCDQASVEVRTRDVSRWPPDARRKIYELMLARRPALIVAAAS